METKFFGLSIEMEGINSHDIAARLFICPRISPEHATKILDMLKAGKLSVGKFEEMTDTYIKELRSHFASGKGIAHLMKNKLETWCATFGEPTKADYQYLKDWLNVTRQDLYEEVREAETRYFASPKEMAESVKETIKMQDDAVDALAVPFYQQYIGMCNDISCSSIRTTPLIIGPTGCGKSATVQEFRKLLGPNYPLIWINMSTVAAETWKGTHMSDIIAYAIKSGQIKVQRDNPTQKVFYTIVLDEFDKIVGRDKNEHSYDIMREIMRYQEAKDTIRINLGDQISPDMYELSLENAMFIFIGAHQGIENIIKKRLNIGKTIGYSSVEKEKQIKNVDLMRQVSHEDLISWGYLPELVSRIGDIIVMNPMTEETVYQILSSKNSILGDHAKFCDKCNIDLRFEEDALRYLANETCKSGLGFRAAKTILARTLNSIYFNLTYGPGRERQVVEISKDFIAQNINIK